MVIIKVLKRGDAASLIVGIAMALIGAGVITAISSSVAGSLVSGGDVTPGFAQGYVLPLVTFVLQLVLLELSLRAIIFLRAAYLKSQ